VPALDFSVSEVKLPQIPRIFWLGSPVKISTGGPRKSGLAGFVLLERLVFMQIYISVYRFEFWRVGECFHAAIRYAQFG
jgi:hypothetical protein